MDFEEVLACLQDTEKCQAFVAKLKNAGKHSKAFFNLRNVMTELRMNKKPHGIDQKTIIQHTLRFTEVDECFQSFRLVCKSWKDAVETIRFNRMVGSDFFNKLNHTLEFHGTVPPYTTKYLQAFRKLHFPIDLLDNYWDENVHEICSLILSSMQNLNTINFKVSLPGNDFTLSVLNEIFILKMLLNSKETLQTLHISKFTLPHKKFLKLSTLELKIGEEYMSLHEFQTIFSRVLKYMENLETVSLDQCGDTAHVCEYIAKNYAKHCISASGPECTLNRVGVQIFTGRTSPAFSGDLAKLENKKYGHNLQYLHMWICANNPMVNGWDRYREILDQYTNLKVIS